jgi:hypothetical protein
VPQRHAHDASAPPARRAAIPRASPSPQRLAVRSARRKPTLPRFDELTSNAGMSKAERQLLSALGEAIPWLAASDATSGGRAAPPPASMRQALAQSQTL